jgi:hypothetical protein
MGRIGSLLKSSIEIALSQTRLSDIVLCLSSLKTKS